MLQHFIDNKNRNPKRGSLGHNRTLKSQHGEFMSEQGGASRRASQGPISTNYYKRKEELEEINRENLRINMKIVTAQAKIPMTK